MWPRPGSTTDAWSVTSTRSFSPRDGCPERRGAPRQAVRWPAVEPCPGARPGPTAVVRSAVEHRARRCGGSLRRGSARGSSWPPTFARSPVEHRARRCGTSPGRPVLSRRRLVGRPLLREGKNGPSSAGRGPSSAGAKLPQRKRSFPNENESFPNGAAKLPQRGAKPPHRPGASPTAHEPSSRGAKLRHRPKKLRQAKDEGPSAPGDPRHR
jgi:hypothetical protein